MQRKTPSLYWLNVRIVSVYNSYKQIQSDACDRRGHIYPEMWGHRYTEIGQTKTGQWGHTPRISPKRTPPDKKDTRFDVRWLGWRLLCLAVFHCGETGTLWIFWEYSLTHILGVFPHILGVCPHFFLFPFSKVEISHGISYVPVSEMTPPLEDTFFYFFYFFLKDKEVWKEVDERIAKERTQRLSPKYLHNFVLK
jgi:hypothetical protein